MTQSLHMSTHTPDATLYTLTRLSQILNCKLWTLKPNTAHPTPRATKQNLNPEPLLNP